jgi:Spy/CpxP family protein refolding chaperone
MTITLPTVAELTHDQILALTELQLEPEQDAQLSHLLDQQQAGTLTPEAHLELEALMQIYQEGLLHKAAALAEAVKRGLIAPLES